MRNATLLAVCLTMAMASATYAIYEPIPGTKSLIGGGVDSFGDPNGAFTIPTAGNVRLIPDAPLRFGDIGWVSIDYAVTPPPDISAGSPRLYFIIDNDFNGVQDPSPFGGRINVFFQDVPQVISNGLVGPSLLSGNTGNMMIPAIFANGGGVFLTPAEVAGAQNYNIMQVRIGNDGGHAASYDNFTVLYAPEPASLGLLAAGGVLMLARRRKV